MRPADIADMAVYFSRQLAKRSAVRQLGLTSGALRQLESYDFPNNIQVLHSLPSRAFLQHDLWTAGLSLNDDSPLCMWNHDFQPTGTCTLHVDRASMALRALPVRGILLASSTPCASGADTQELEGIVSRAVRQAAQSLETAQVPEDVFWYAQQVGEALLLPFQRALQAVGRVSKPQH